MLNQLLAEQAQITEEIAAFQQMAANLGKLNPPPAPITQEPAEHQEGNKMTIALPSNWKTTLSGLIAAASTGIGTAYPQYQWLTTWLTPIALGALGLSAKDGNVTGGTVSAVTGKAGKPVSLIDTQ
jgi:hypothetical protein